MDVGRRPMQPSSAGAENRPRREAGRRLAELRWLGTSPHVVVAGDDRPVVLEGARA